MSLEECAKATGGAASFDCVPILFQNIVQGALILAGATALFFILFAGIRFILSGGDPKQVEAARHTLTYAIIGLVLIFSSFFIINVIAYITGVDCITMFGFTNCK